MKKDHTQSDSVSCQALKLLIGLSGIKQRVISERLKISEEYLSKILNGKREGKVMRVRIYNYVLEINSAFKKIAA